MRLVASSKRLEILLDCPAPIEKISGFNRAVSSEICPTAEIPVIALSFGNADVLYFESIKGTSSSLKNFM